MSYHVDVVHDVPSLTDYVLRSYRCRTKDEIADRVWRCVTHRKGIVRWNTRWQPEGPGHV